jgi:hypothetical protein
MGNGYSIDQIKNNDFSFKTLTDFYGQVLARQNLQCQRRLFHLNHDEANQPQSLLTLQRV